MIPQSPRAIGYVALKNTTEEGATAGPVGDTPASLQPNPMSLASISPSDPEIVVQKKYPGPQATLNLSKPVNTSYPLVQTTDTKTMR